MFESLKSKINTLFFKNSISDSYKKVSEIEGKEEVYYQENKLAIVIKDENIGQRIYNIVKSLKDNKETISSLTTTFSIYKYTTINDNQIETIYANFTFERAWNELSKLEKMREMVSFVDDMNSKGYFLDNHNFDKYMYFKLKNSQEGIDTCPCVTSFLSCFVLNSENEKSSNDCLIKFIHYVFSGKDLKQFYQSIVENGYCSTTELSYNLPIVKMCYEYFLNNTFSGNISDVLKEEYESSNFYCAYLLFNKNKFESKYSKIKENGEYTIYDGNIKIYNNIESDFRRFLSSINSRFWYAKQSLEQIERIVIDLNEKVIGYKYNLLESNNISLIDDRVFESQSDLISYFSELSNFLLEINNLDLYDRKKIDNFKFDKIVVKFDDGFKITNIEELFNLIICDQSIIRNQITTAFFETYLKYLNGKYGQLQTEDELLSKKEVRYLSPVITQEFINYVLNKQIDYTATITELFKFFNNTKKLLKSEELYFDSRYEFDPISVPIVFDYEVENKYGIKIRKGMNEILPQGNKLVTFSRKRRISVLKENENNIVRKMNQSFKRSGLLNGNNVILIGISQIIYSKTIDENNLYVPVGYLTEPIKGRPLTTETFKSFSNKDFLMTAAHLFTKFNENYINLDSIYMDENYNFYIDLFNENFSITQNSHRESFTVVMAKYLLANRICSHNIFVDISLSSFYFPDDSYGLKDKAYKMNSYCDEHKIFFNKNESICPICQKTKFIVTKDMMRPENKIFEDEYATHYRASHEYNLKVYKQANVDMAFLKQKIEEIVCDTSVEKFGQNCFIPEKKAIDHNKNFIGCVYDAVDFDSDSLINLNDLEKLKNLPRLKSLIRLLTQYNSCIAQKKCGFKINPFTNVFLAKTVKRQVQILNIEFLSEDKDSYENSKKWIYKYACDIVALDPCIEVDISNCSTYFEILEVLTISSKDLTKYCPFHKKYYHNKFLFCPECVDVNELDNVEVVNISKSSITNAKSMNEGGESYIYPYKNGMIVKVFKEEKVDMNLKTNVIAGLLRKRRILREINDNNNRNFKYVIPKKIFVDIDSKNIFGYIMDEVKDGTQISSLRDIEVVKEHGLTRKDVLEILITTGIGIETLHKETNIYIGDLNGRNILFDSQKNVYFLDFDGMGIDNIKPEFCTDGYIDPVSKKTRNITMKDDWYSFAIQAFYYLTFTHPFNGIHYIEKSGKRALTEIPDKMELKMSLLGNHGLEPPEIAEPWDWMNEDLLKVFLDTFEGDTRVSIVPYLIKQYKSLYGIDFVPDNKEFNNSEENAVKDNSVRINSKFIAIPIVNDFTNVKHVINQHAVVSNNGFEDYVHVIKVDNNVSRVFNLNIPNCMEIKDILFSDDAKLAFVIYKDNSMIVYDTINNVNIFGKSVFGEVSNAVINDKNLYYTNTSTSEDIKRIKFLPNHEIQTDVIDSLTDKKIKHFSVRNNSKFVIVKEAEAGIDAIYCNSQKLCNIHCNFSDSHYNIMYDSYTKLWLVVNSEGNAISINSKDGSFKELNLKDYINDSETYNIDNLAFNKGNIYVPCQNCLYIISTTDKFVRKRLECSKFMTPETRIFGINNAGFSIIADNCFYGICRG